ncbi:hypothetical protein NDK43_06650 [Neobacillus pocheonensis]|uniref:HTH merR-type domain-containing protein n=1 Tax=Neobacillus pocheonensis TaxID=363869 RepID=A0ABT0W729_9BACI|nr:hypothetical protein [Neobacillus pocheonensis]
MEQNERVYWTHEVAERLEMGESTLRKWSIALEKQGHSFIKGDQERRLFLETDIQLLLKMKEEPPIPKKRSVLEATEIALNKWRTSLVPVEEERTALVPLTDPTYMETMSKMFDEKLKERDSFWLKIVEERDSFFLSKLEEKEKKHEERQAFLLKKIEESGERVSFLEEKNDKELQEIKEEQMNSRKLIESNGSIISEELQAERKKSDRMFNELMKEIAATQEKKKDGSGECLENEEFVLERVNEFNK